jgi:tRNA-modifying protein YgfZ
MPSRWIDYLRTQGARVGVDTGRDAVRGFGDPPQELHAAHHGSVVAPLTHLGVLAFSGDDARDFLQGQLSSDVNALAVGQAQLSAYCSAKGRVLANFLLWRESGRFVALLSADLVEATRKRLSMFVLRAKVRVEDLGSQYPLLGTSGVDAAAVVTQAFGIGPAIPAWSMEQCPAGSVLNLGEDRFIAVVDPAAAEASWSALAAKLTPVGEAAWRWMDIRAGLPWITAATSDEFVPQMANLDLIGAVNFQKGCYPGQEIVARTQYLGKLKRRLYRLHADAGALAPAGTHLYGAELGDQPAGMVVDLQPAPDGGCDLLAVVQIDAVRNPVHLGTPDGPALSLLPLPYDVAQAA